MLSLVSVLLGRACRNLQANLRFTSVNYETGAHFHFLLMCNVTRERDRGQKFIAQRHIRVEMTVLKREHDS